MDQVHRSGSGRVWWDWIGGPWNEEEPLVGVIQPKPELLCGKCDVAGIEVRQGGPWGGDANCSQRDSGCARGRRDVCARGNEFSSPHKEDRMIQTEQ